MSNKSINELLNEQNPKSQAQFLPVDDTTVDDTTIVDTPDMRMDIEDTEDMEYMEYAEWVKLTEESLELMEYKKDFYDMSVGSIRAIMHHAQQIINSLDNPMVAENLTTSWLQGKIAVTEDYMKTIHSYIMFVSEKSDKSDESNTLSKDGLWDNIRQKRLREGKKYKPAKRGDKDRPDTKQWKKLTSRFISDPVVWDEKTDDFVDKNP